MEDSKNPAHTQSDLQGSGKDSSQKHRSRRSLPVTLTGLSANDCRNVSLPTALRALLAQIL
jgi:hypothetical protein